MAVSTPPKSAQNIAKTRSNTSPPKGAQSALRAIQLLKAFTAEHPELTLGQLSKRFKLNKTTAHRLLAALESEQLLDRNPDTGAYRLGQEMMSLGLLAMASNDARTKARPIMERLAQLCHETVTLEVLSGNDIVIIDEVDGGHVIGAVGHIGTRWPAHATSTGKCILANQGSSHINSERQSNRGSSAERENIDLFKFTSKTITDAQELQREYGRIQKRGYAVAVDELELGYTAVAITLQEPGNRVRVAVSIGGPTSRLTRTRRKELGELLVREFRDLNTC